VHDLEAKLKAHSDKADSRDNTIVELQKELGNFRDNNLNLRTHASELEQLLARSEGDVGVLARQMEKYESEAAQRESAYRSLEARLDLLSDREDNKALLRELKKREGLIAALERQRDDLLGSRDQASTNGTEYGISGLRSQLASLNISTPNVAEATSDSAIFENAQEIIRSSRSFGPANQELTPPESPESQRDGQASKNNEIIQLQTALKSLTARCSEAESQSSQASARVADLRSQLSEAKLIHAELDDVVPSSPSLPSSVHGDDASETGSMLQTPKASSPSPSPTERRGSRRGSTPLLISATSGYTTVGRGRDFRGGRGIGESKRVR